LTSGETSSGVRSGPASTSKFSKLVSAKRISTVALVHGYAAATAWAAGLLVLGSIVTVILINADPPAPHAAQRPAS
jgi:hypothetical protein